MTLLNDKENDLDQELPRVAARSGASFSRSEVTQMLKAFVYPPCDKRPNEIVQDDTFEGDLGMSPAGRRARAGRTNAVFALETPHKFSGPEMLTFDTVGEHNDATRKKLKALGRLTS